MEIVMNASTNDYSRSFTHLEEGYVYEYTPDPANEHLGTLRTTIGGCVTQVWVEVSRQTNYVPPPVEHHLATLPASCACHPGILQIFEAGSNDCGPSSLSDCGIRAGGCADRGISNGWGSQAFCFPVDLVYPQWQLRAGRMDVNPNFLRAAAHAISV